MRSALHKLMPSCTNRRASESVPRRQRLGVETLDERCLPSVTTSLSNGILAINADQNTTSAIAIDMNGYVTVSDQNFHVYSYKDSQVQKMVFNAGNNAMADYSFTNYTNINTDYYTGPGGGTDSGGGGVNRFYAGTGGATCLGGAGTNYFYDNANSIGGDYQAGWGTNVLSKVGPYSYLQTQEGVTPGPMFTVGLLSGIYNNPQLLNDSAISGTSSITAYLNSTDTVLTFSGPIGGGFQLDGNWTDTLESAGNGLYTHNFSSTGTVRRSTSRTTTVKSARSPGASPITGTSRTFPVPSPPAKSRPSCSATCTLPQPVYPGQRPPRARRTRICGAAAARMLENAPIPRTEKLGDLPDRFGSRKRAAPAGESGGSRAALARGLPRNESPGRGHADSVAVSVR